MSILIYNNKIRLNQRFKVSDVEKDYDIYIHYKLPKDGGKDGGTLQKVVTCMVIFCLGGGANDPQAEKDSFLMTIDERFSEINFTFTSPQGNLQKKVTNFLKAQYERLKSTDFRYSRGDGYITEKTLYFEQFIDFLRQANRDSILENLLN